MPEDTTQMIALVLIIVTLSHVPLQAYEYDPYACYYQMKQKTDNRTIEHTNKFIEDGLDKAIEAANTRIARNSSYENCNENVLIVQVNDHVGGRFFSEIEEYAWEDMPERYRCEVSKKESIYNESGFNVLVLLDWFTGNALHPMIRMCGVNFGIDKFGHFMGQGMEYYLRFRHYRDYRQVLSWGLGKEENFIGKKSTGIKSYGDLSANFSGLFFWRNLYDKDNTNGRAYVQCVNGQLKRSSRSFDWCDYVNHSWDEANNCSEFDESTSQAVNQNLRKLRESTKRKYECPMEDKNCADAINYFTKLIGESSFRLYNDFRINFPMFPFIWQQTPRQQMTRDFHILIFLNHFRKL